MHYRFGDKVRKGKRKIYHRARFKINAILDFTVELLFYLGLDLNMLNYELLANHSFRKL